MPVIGRAGLKHLLLLVIAPPAIASAKPAVAPLLVGNWAGDGFALGADADRATVQNGCSHGRTLGPVKLAANGGFSAAGYFNPPHSGYRLKDIAPRDQPAVFSGTLSGSILTLAVVIGGKPGVPHRLARGAHIKFPKCD